MYLQELEDNMFWLPWLKGTCHNFPVFSYSCLFFDLGNLCGFLANKNFLKFCLLFTEPLYAQTWSIRGPSSGLVIDDFRLWPAVSLWAYWFDFNHVWSAFVTLSGTFCSAFSQMVFKVSSSLCSISSTSWPQVLLSSLDTIKISDSSSPFQSATESWQHQYSQAWFLEHLKLLNLDWEPLVDWIKEWFQWSHDSVV